MLALLLVLTVLILTPNEYTQQSTAELVPSHAGVAGLSSTALMQC